MSNKKRIPKKNIKNYKKRGGAYPPPELNLKDILDGRKVNTLQLGYDDLRLDNENNILKYLYYYKLLQKSKELVLYEGETVYKEIYDLYKAILDKNEIKDILSKATTNTVGFGERPMELTDDEGKEIDFYINEPSMIDYVTTASKFIAYVSILYFISLMITWFIVMMVAASAVGPVGTGVGISIAVIAGIYVVYRLVDETSKMAKRWFRNTKAQSLLDSYFSYIEQNKLDAEDIDDPIKLKLGIQDVFNFVRVNKYRELSVDYNVDYKVEDLKKLKNYNKLILAFFILEQNHKTIREKNRFQLADRRKRLDEIENKMTKINNIIELNVGRIELKVGTTSDISLKVTPFDIKYQILIEVIKKKMIVKDEKGSFKKLMDGIKLSFGIKSSFLPEMLDIEKFKNRMDTAKVIPDKDFEDLKLDKIPEYNNAQVSHIIQQTLDNNVTDVDNLEKQILILRDSIGDDSLEEQYDKILQQEQHERLNDAEKKEAEKKSTKLINKLKNKAEQQLDILNTSYNLILGDGSLKEYDKYKEECTNIKGIFSEEGSKITDNGKKVKGIIDYIEKKNDELSKLFVNGNISENSKVLTFHLSKRDRDIFKKIDMALFNGQLVIMQDVKLEEQYTLSNAQYKLGIGSMKYNKKLRVGYIVKDVITEGMNKEYNIEEELKKSPKELMRMLRNTNIKTVKCTKLDSTKHQILQIDSSNYDFKYIQEESIEKLNELTDPNDFRSELKKYKITSESLSLIRKKSKQTTSETPADKVPAEEAPVEEGQADEGPAKEGQADEGQAEEGSAEEGSRGGAPQGEEKLETKTVTGIKDWTMFGKLNVDLSGVIVHGLFKRHSANNIVPVSMLKVNRMMDEESNTSSDISTTIESVKKGMNDIIKRDIPVGQYNVICSYGKDWQTTIKRLKKLINLPYNLVRGVITEALSPALSKLGKFTGIDKLSLSDLTTKKAKNYLGKKATNSGKFMLSSLNYALKKTGIRKTRKLQGIKLYKIERQEDGTLQVTSMIEPEMSSRKKVYKGGIKRKRIRKILRRTRKI